MIYSELIASRNVAILQVSQQVHDEAKDRLHKQGICRLQFRHRGYDFDIVNPPKSSLSKVQNFDIEIYFDCDEHYVGSLDYRRFVQRARDFAPGSQPCVQGAGSCTITLVLASAKHPHLPRSVLQFINRLRTFKLVTLRAHTTCLYHPFDRRIRDTMKPEHENLLKQASTDLRWYLGDPEWRSEPDYGTRGNLLMRPLANPFPGAPYLEFYPREAERVPKAPGSTVWQGCLCDSFLETV